MQASTQTLPSGTKTLSSLDALAGKGIGVLRLLDLKAARAPPFIAAWRALGDQASEPNPFFEEWFANPSFEQFATGDTTSGADHCLATYWIGERLIGVLPLARSSNYYGHTLPHMSAWVHNNTFCGVPLVAKGCETGFWKALLDHLDNAPWQALFLHLPALPQRGPLNQALTKVLRDMRRSSAIVERSSRAQLASDLSPEEYVAQAMSAKKRKELRRQRKRLSELGDLTFERLEGTDRLEPWIEQFLTLEAAGWKGQARSSLKDTSATYAFFSDALHACAQVGKLERLTLRLDGRPIAMLANFLTEPGAYSFKTAFDEDYARFSPGLLLQIENLDILKRPGVAWTDSCAVEGHSMIERIWREKREFVSRNVAIGGPLRRLTARALMAYETREWN